jgi:L,D-transpeptidase YcbB
MIGCKSKDKNHRIDERDSVIYSNQNYSELSLDSTKLLAFFVKNPSSDSIQNQVAQFYSWRGFQYAWLSKNGLSLAAINFYEQLNADSEIFSDKSLISRQLDSLFVAANSNEKNFLTQTQNVEKLELLLTVTFFKYAEKVYTGTTENVKNLDWYIPRKKKNYLVLLDSLVSQSGVQTLQEPVNEYYTRLKQKLIVYRAIQRKGGFPEILAVKKSHSIGDSAIYFTEIKQHLQLTGDLKFNDNTPFFTDSLVAGLKSFQRSTGLVESGKLDVLTLKELNKTVDFRIKQIMVNLERLRWVPVQMEKDYLLINIPEFKLHVFENNKLSWETNVVVGKTARRTSIFKGNISQIVLNPYWGIPTSIVRDEILPKIKRNRNYLANNNMEVIDGNYRQKPGINNALGKVKFLFPNNYNIYLHDTPSKSLFKENARAFSHGCIRVQNPFKLANYLFRNMPAWNAAKVDKVLATNVSTSIKISPTVPVYIAYFTAWVDNTGQLNFRNDLYNLDDKLSNEVFGEVMAEVVK